MGEGGWICCRDNLRHAVGLKIVVLYDWKRIYKSVLKTIFDDLKATQYVSLSEDNGESYSEFFVKIILQIGSEDDIVAKLICKNINANSSASNMPQYSNELLSAHPEIKHVTVECDEKNCSLERLAYRLACMVEGI